LRSSPSPGWRDGGRGATDSLARLAIGGRRPESYRHDSVKRFLLLGIAVGALIVVLLGALFLWRPKSAPISIRRSDVVSVRIEPEPEGPMSPIFDRKESNGSRSLNSILNAIPVPLPGPDRQPFGCSSGGDLIITLRDGREITYGPCSHPRSIRRLWASMVTVLSDGRCTRPCAPIS
jgi:hypothetical protein